MVRDRLAASGVQLGRKVVVEGQEIVEFIAASAGREDMVGQVSGRDSAGINKQIQANISRKAPR